MIIVLGWSIAYLKGIQIDFPQIIVRDDRFVARSPNDFSCSLGSSQRTNKEENLKSQEVIITSNAKKQWKVKKKISDIMSYIGSSLPLRLHPILSKSPSFTNLLQVISILSWSLLTFTNQALPQALINLIFFVLPSHCWIFKIIKICCLCLHND